MLQKFHSTVFFLFFLGLLHAQTPQQSYFEWTELPFGKEELLQRRTDLIERLKTQNKTGLVLIPAKDGFSYGETFRQLDDFYYFTGLELPNALLAIEIPSGKMVVYTPEMDRRFQSDSRPNDFPGRPLLNDPEIPVKTGLILKNITDFPAFIQAKSSIPILVNNGSAGEIKFASDQYIATPSPIQIVIQALRTQHNISNFENSYNAIAEVRMIKSKAEIAIMKKATIITAKSIMEAAKSIRSGVDERYLEGVLEGHFKKLGAQRLAFGSIIKSGPNSLWPWRILATHYNRRNRTMEAGDLVVFDVGCEYNNYVSDMGRTFPVSGKFTARQREVLAMEVGIADQIIAYLKPGITFKDIRRLTDRIIPKDAKEYMQVGLFYGHHLGLSSGDPNLPEAVLKPGMIFTVEPWYYNHDEQLSVFTEDVVLITASGCEVLSKDLPRTPEALEKMVRP
ncbi:MAG: Xaa-Pro peptidase family protein [Maribacter sp.]|nr:Xaa-Pro peptidase family protein [Maribacter sp.]MBT8315501.1 Xaa-Pro peptidase family protein [Maribacter sp.]